MSAIGTNRSAAIANSGQSIPKDEPEYAGIGPPGIIITKKLSDCASANCAAVPSYASEPRYNEVWCNARRFVPA